MAFIGKIARYIAAFIVFMIAYGVASFLAHIVIGFINSDVAGWVRDYVLPYFVAAFAGPIGVVAGFSLIEKILPTVRLRPVTWSFAIFIGIIWLMALIFPLINGDRFDDGITVMAVQSIAALIVGFKFSAVKREGDLDSHARANLR